MLVLDGPLGQVASAMAIADDLNLPVHLGDARVRAYMWSDDGEGLQEFLGAILVRQLRASGG